jgi:hypothetical protein
MSRIVVKLVFEIDRDELPEVEDLRQAHHAAMRRIIQTGEQYSRAHWTADFVNPGIRKLTGRGGGTNPGIKMKLGCRYCGNPECTEGCRT